jgi:hypothetical protein
MDNHGWHPWEVSLGAFYWRCGGAGTVLENCLMVLSRMELQVYLGSAPNEVKIGLKREVHHQTNLSSNHIL